MVEDAIPAMMWTARPDLSCDYLSRPWLEFTGYSAEQALGDGWSRGVHPEDLGRWLDTCVRAFDAREPFEIEYRLRRYDGEYRWVLDRGVPRFSGAGEFVGYAGVCMDIHERNRAQHELASALERERRLRRASEEASRVKDGFLTTILDDLQPPVLAGVRVLVVNEDCAARDAFTRTLGLAGAETRIASSAAEALEAVVQWRPDVLVSDLDMPASEGYGLIRALRSLPAEQGGRIRAAALAHGGARAVAAGYDAQLAKPVEPVTLLATIARLQRGTDVALDLVPSINSRSGT